jgi:hypothetical protein
MVARLVTHFSGNPSSSLIFLDLHAAAILVDFDRTKSPAIQERPSPTV